MLATLNGASGRCDDASKDEMMTGVWVIFCKTARPGVVVTPASLGDVIGRCADAIKTK